MLSRISLRVFFALFTAIVVWVGYTSVQYRREEVASRLFSPTGSLNNSTVSFHEESLLDTVFGSNGSAQGVSLDGEDPEISQQLSALAHFPRLEYVFAFGLTSYPNFQLPSVRHLNLGSCSPESVSRLIKACPNVEYLEVADSLTYEALMATDESLKAIAGCSKLQELNVNVDNCTGEFLLLLSPQCRIKKMSLLTDVGITQEAIWKVSKFEDLEELTIVPELGVSVEALKRMPLKDLGLLHPEAAFLD